MNNCDLSKQVSDDELKNIGLSNIIKYGDLNRYDNLLDLLPDVGSYVIILIESKYNRGHWTCLVRKSKNIIYYFDSYGKGVDGELEFIAPEERQRLGESEKILTRLISQLPRSIRVISNHIDYQKDSPEVSTCGRHVMFFIMSILKHGLTMEQYHKLISIGVSKTRVNPDHLICMLTNEYL